MAHPVRHPAALLIASSLGGWVGSLGTRTTVLAASPGVRKLRPKRRNRQRRRLGGIQSSFVHLRDPRAHDGPIKQVDDLGSCDGRIGQRFHRSVNVTNMIVPSGSIRNATIIPGSFVSITTPFSSNLWYR